MSNVFKSNSRFASLIEDNKNDNNISRVSPSRADRPNNFNRQRNNYDTCGLRRESVVEKKKLYLLHLYIKMVHYVHISKKILVL